jgi:hypothetical protein
MPRDASLVAMPTGGKPMTEDLPLAATTVKGATRAAMTAELLAAAEARRVRFGRRADFIGHPGLPHSYSYVPDIAAGLATLGTDARAEGQVWHLPGPPTGSATAFGRSPG